MIAAGMLCGGDDSSSTSTTTIPEQTPEEQKLQALSTSFIFQYMKDSGYDVNPKTTFKYDNPDKVAELQSQLDEMDKQIAANPTAANRGGVPGLPGIAGRQGQTLVQQRNAIANQLAEEKGKGTETTDYDLQLNETGKKLQDLRSKSIDYQSQMQDMFMTNAKKFLSGDYSITDAQKKQIEDSLGAIREPVTKLLDNLNQEYQNTGKSMNDAIKGYVDEIKATGLSTGAAINAISDRIDDTKAGVVAGLSNEEKKLAETGNAVQAAIQGIKTEINNTQGAATQEMEKLFAIKRQMVKQDMTDDYNKMRSANAVQAARLGRSQFDPVFAAQLQDNLMKNINTADLGLAEMESMQKLGLITAQGAKRENVAAQEANFAETQGRGAESLAAKGTAATEAAGLRKEAVAGEQAALAERQGTKLEGAAAQKIGVAERTGAGAENVAAQKAELEKGLQTTGQNLRWQMGIDLPAKAAGLGMDVGGYMNALNQQYLANTATAANMPVTQQGMMQQERMAQPTTTTTQSGGVFGDIMGAIGAGAGAAGSIMSGVGAIQGFGASASSGAAAMRTPTFSIPTNVSASTGNNYQLQYPTTASGYR